MIGALLVTLLRPRPEAQDKVVHVEVAVGHAPQQQPQVASVCALVMGAGQRVRQAQRGPGGRRARRGAAGPDRLVVWREVRGFALAAGDGSTIEVAAGGAQVSVRLGRRRPMRSSCKHVLQRKMGQIELKRVKEG